MVNPTNQQADKLKELDQTNKAAKRLGLPVVRLNKGMIQNQALALIDKKLALEYRLIPFELEDQNLKIALADPSLLSQPAPAFLGDLRQRGLKLLLHLTPASDFQDAVAAYDQEMGDRGVKSQLTAQKPAKSDFKPTPAGQVNDTSVQPSRHDTVDLTNIKIPQNILHKFPEEVAQKYQMVVFAASVDGKEVSVAAINPEDPKIKDIISFIEQRNQIKVKLFQTSVESLNQALSGYQADDKKEKSKEESAIPSVPTAIPSRTRVDELKEVLHKQSELKKPFVAAAAEPTKASSVIPQPAINVSAPAPVAAEAPAQGTPATGATSIQQPNTNDETNLDKILGTSIASVEAIKSIVASGVVPKIIAAFISYAVSLQASDIHIEGAADSVRLRYRVDGVLRDIIQAPKQLLAPLVSRIKILSKLKIDETRLPQDGRFSVQIAGRAIDLRVSTLPTVHGEKVVLRVLDKSTGVKELKDLGIEGINMARVSRAIEDPYGIILVTGPTGSGKTTTLYALLTKLNQPAVNIVTLEDPVEYQLGGINQTQIKPKIGYSFAEGLRSIVRQDPDIIMVGEIRDAETATLATQAALTGHLVLSTLHTNNAAGAMPRLIDMEVEPFLLSSSLNIVIAQRLVRKLCKKCRVEAKSAPEVLELVKKELQSSQAPEIKAALSQELKFFAAKGCEDCRTGFKGRIGIYEVLNVSDTIAQLVIKKAAAGNIEQQARTEGMITMRQDGILKALAGITTLEEVIQVTAD